MGAPTTPAEWLPVLAAELDAVHDRKADPDDPSLDKLRRLCQLWDVDLRCSGITSHRPVLGPFIVAMKKLFYPFLRVFLKDALQQQRDFNAAAVSLLADLASKQLSEK